MKGTQKVLIEEVKERMSVKSAITEFIDNSFDHARTRIDIIIDQNSNTIKCMNDGIPMSGINNYVSNFTSHIEQTHKKNQISKFGKGSKKAFIKLGDSKNGSILHIYSKDKDYNKIQYASITMKEKKNDECFEESYVDFIKDTSVIPYNEGTCMVIQNVDKAIWTDIHGMNEDDGSERNDYNNLISYCKEHYGLVAYTNKVELYVNNVKIEFEDPCLLLNLGNNINKDGCYLIDGICYWVHTYICKNATTKENAKFKTVYAYIPRMRLSDKEMPRSKGYEMYAGYYTYYGNRLMDNGGNYRKFFNRCPSNLTTGGCDRIRVAIFTDNNEKFFNITSTKSEGIEPFKTNENFSHFQINGVSVYSVLRNDLLSWVKLNEYDRKDKTLKQLTISNIKDVAVSYSKTKKVNKGNHFSSTEELNEIFHVKDSKKEINNIEDVINDITSSCDLFKEIDSTPYMTERDKEILYEIGRTLGKNNEKLFNDCFNNVSKLIKEKYGTETNIISKQAA